MKHLVLFFVMMFFLTFAYSQKEIAQVSFNKYEMVEQLSDGTIQVGYFKVMDNHMVRHGVWKLIKNGEVVKKAYYENGEFMWIECIVNGKFTKDQLQIEKLKKEVERLKADVASTY